MAHDYAPRPDGLRVDTIVDGAMTSIIPCSICAQPEEHPEHQAPPEPEPEPEPAPKPPVKRVTKPKARTEAKPKPATKRAVKAKAKK